MESIQILKKLEKDNTYFTENNKLILKKTYDDRKKKSTQDFPSQELFHSVCPKNKLCSSNSYFGIQFKQGLIWDITAFRPDPRDYPSFINDIISSRKKFVVVYEKYLDNKGVISGYIIPRFIFWNSIIFVNIR